MRHQKLALAAKIAKQIIDHPPLRRIRVMAAFEDMKIAYPLHAPHNALRASIRYTVVCTVV